MEVVGPPSSHQELAVLGHRKRSVVRGRPKWRRDLVLVVEGVHIPGMDGVIFEAGQDHVCQGDKENLDTRKVRTLHMNNWPHIKSHCCAKHWPGMYLKLMHQSL